MKISNEQAWEALKKYDKDCYEYYKNNAHLFGWNARNYAEYLLRKKEKTS